MSIPQEKGVLRNKSATANKPTRDKEVVQAATSFNLRLLPIALGGEPVPPSAKSPSSKVSLLI
jgi:hypothetical protein